MSRIFVDTSAWFAYFNRLHPVHDQVRPVLEAAEAELVTSNFISDELLTLLLAKVGHALAVQAGRCLREERIAIVVRVEPTDEEEAWDRFQNRHGLSFTDCTSFALMRRLGITSAATLDSDFRRAGFTVLP